MQVAERLSRADVANAQLVCRAWAEAWAATVLSLAPGAMSAPPAPGCLRLRERFPQLQARRWPPWRAPVPGTCACA